MTRCKQMRDLNSGFARENHTMHPTVALNGNTALVNGELLSSNGSISASSTAFLTHCRIAVAIVTSRLMEASMSNIDGLER
jgi:hypothetical protein